MFKPELLFPIFIYLINAVLSGIYAVGLLKSKYKRNITLIAWSVLYFISQIIIFETLDKIFPLDYVIKIIVNFLLLFFIQKLLFYKDALKYLFTSFSFMAGSEIVKHISSALSNIILQYLGDATVNLYEKGVFASINTVMLCNNICLNITLWFCMFIQGVLLATYLYIIVKIFAKKDYHLNLQENLLLMFPSVTVLCISITLRLMIFSVENGITKIIYDSAPATKFLIPLIFVLLLGVMLSYIVLFQKMLQCNEEEQKRILFENQIVQVHKEIKEIQDIYTGIRELKHDLHEHLTNISAFINQNSMVNNKELTNYINRMKETVGRLDFSYQTGNPITDIIIHQKCSETDKKHINFYVDFTYPSTLKIDVYDVGIILNNALKNAVEACETIDGERSISLRSYIKGSMFFMEIENNFEGAIKINDKTGLPVSGKQDLQIHGIGMTNMKRCAEKYLGDIDFEICDIDNKRTFNLTVMMRGNISRQK